MRREHREILCEHRPDGLEHEAPQHLGLRGTPLLKPSVNVGDELDGPASDLGLVVNEHRPAAREEEERIEAVWQLDEVEHRAWFRVDRPWLPYLEAMESAEHDIAGCRTGGRPRALPVTEHLLAVRVKPTRLARTLHLEDADARPEEIHESVCGALFEARAFGPSVDPVAIQEIVQECLRFALLRPGVTAPRGSELAQPPPNLLALKSHGAA
jgi:hypothetical protein